jgi:hypothetical protein
MLQKGWECHFKPFPARCQLTYQGDILGDVSLTGNLVFLDLKFICPNEVSPVLPPQELAMFTHVPMSWDLWHA